MGALPTELVNFLRELANDLPDFADQLRINIDLRSGECGTQCDFSGELEIARALDANASMAQAFALAHDLAGLEGGER